MDLVRIYLYRKWVWKVYFGFGSCLYRVWRASGYV